ncbi:PAS domain-containing protein [Azospirillum argentinense]|nr:PAS domain-containing protein [Azospirillum argentinense]
MSLLHRLLLLVLVAMIPAAVIEVRNELALRAAREAEVGRDALHLASLFEAEQHRMIDGLRQVLSTLVKADPARAPGSPACQALMDDLRASYPGHLGIVIAGLDGVVRCSTDHAALGISIADRDYFRDALDSGRMTLGEHVFRRTDGRSAMPVALAFQDAEGRAAGVVTAMTDISWIADFLSKRPLSDNARITLVDRRDRVVAQVPQVPPLPNQTGSSQTGPSQTDGGVLSPSVIALLSRDAPGVAEVTGPDGRPRIVAYQPTGRSLDGIGVVVCLDKGEALGPIRGAMVQAMTGIAIVLLLTLLAVWWGASRFLRRPVAALVATAERWKGGDLTARSGVADQSSELGTLARAFDSMVEELARQQQVREQANALAHKTAAVLGSITDGVFEVDRHWRITFMNERARTLIAGGRNLIGQDLWDVFPEVAASAFGENYRRAMQDQTPVEFEEYCTAFESWFAVRAFPSPDGLAVFFQDTTARKWGEAALVSANREKNALLAQLNSLLQNAPVGFAFFDRERRYIRINEQLADCNGILAEAHMGRTLADLMPVVGASVEPLIDRVFDSGEPIPYREIVGETPKEPGVTRHWLTALFPVHEGMEVAAVGAVVMEVTDLRRAETARRQSDERFRSVFELAAVGIERVGLDGRILDVNAKICDIIGYPREELLRRTYRDITDPADLAAEEELIERLLSGELSSYALEKRYRRKDGGAVWVRVTSSLARITGTEPAYRITVAEDITERKAMEAELRSARDEAERANLAKSKFLAAASHDLRQPLQSLFFFAAALSAHVGSPAGTKILTHLEQGLDALKGLLDSLLDVSRLDAGVVTPVFEDFDIGEVLDPIRAAYAPVAAGKGIGWQVEVAAGRVRSDRTLLGRLLRNLVENAIRYTETGLVRVQCRPDGRFLSIVVQDTGMGIPDDHLERIFEEFHQVGNPERDRNQGLGLGLAIVRRLSRLLDHPVEVRSAVGKGSAFRVLVPMGETVDAAAAGAGGAAPGMGQGRLAVLVDDDAIVLMGLQLILTEWGYAVLAAGSADQAIERLSAQTRVPDIVIADYRLREGRIGTEVILRVRERYGSGIPGVILTGETGPDCLLDATAHGLTVIHKPVTPRELAAAVDQQLKAVSA